MKKRYLYAVLWGVPGLLFAAMGTAILIGILVGMLWLYVFGDNAWPSFIGTLLTVLGISTFLILWIGLTLHGYRIGKQRERQPGIPWSHILLSTGMTLAFVLYIVIQQFSVGNLGPKADSVRCSLYCQQRGYTASGMSPGASQEQTCSCYDDSGREVIKVLLEIITSETLK